MVAADYAVERQRFGQVRARAGTFLPQAVSKKEGDQPCGNAIPEKFVPAGPLALRTAAADAKGVERGDSTIGPHLLYTCTLIIDCRARVKSVVMC